MLKYLHMLTRFSTWLVEKLLKKYFQIYNKNFNKKLPMVAIFGSVGKSSQTAIIVEMFRNDGYLVYSSKKNTITGLGMLLAGVDYNFEGIFGFVYKIRFIISLLLANFKTNFFGLGLKEKSILILEIGFDREGETDEYKRILENNLDIAVITALTDEHNLNYSNAIFGQTNILKGYLPKNFINNLENSVLPIDTKNVILEMLKPVVYSRVSIIGDSLGEITNSLMIVKQGDSQEIATKNVNLSEINSMYDISNKYLLPDTFAKTFQIAIEVASEYQISNKAIKDAILNFKLPPSRFSLLKGILDTTIVDSSYNSDPDSVFSFLNSLEKEIVKNKNNHTLVLGEMRELGDIATQKHCEVLKRICEIQAQHDGYLEEVVLVGKEWVKCDFDSVKKVQGDYQVILFKPDKNKDSILKKFLVFTQVGRVYEYLEDKIRPRSFIWIKGSQNTIFLEILVERLLANQSDKSLVCRQEQRWIKLRKPYE
jgi:UDP-N-acetylmuramyl pentapeptide synthase